MRVLQIGDMQNGFTREDGSLYVAGAGEIIAPANEFLERAGGVYDLVLVVQDTHFAETYGDSVEIEAFPLHCDYGTRDWELSVAVPVLPTTRYLLKDTYSMWSGGATANRPTDPGQRAAYETLFQIVDDPPGADGADAARCIPENARARQRGRR